MGVPFTVPDLVADARHAGALEGAGGVGEASGGQRLVVRVGVWLEPSGRVGRARFRASTCAALIAYAEAACALSEGGPPARAPGAGALRAAVGGVHPVHHDRAALVALALGRALSAASTPQREAPP